MRPTQHNFRRTQPGVALILLLSSSLALAEAEDDLGISALDDLSCLIEPSETVELSSQQPGIVEGLLVERGDPVKQDQPLVQLAAGVERAAVRLAEARQAFGLRKSERNLELVQKELISSQEKDEMDTELQIATAELEEARARLALRTINSPITGVVIERYKAPGDYVGEDPILKLLDVDPLNVEVIAPVAAWGLITPGMRAEVTTDVDGKRFEARVTIVDPALDPSSDTYGVRLSLPNPGNRIPAGLKCSSRFLP
ncbi:MAG: efflux RND transporter periplasmic adaptor subunit [Gammaproteobacteria bacterium]